MRPDAAPFVRASSVRAQPHICMPFHAHGVGGHVASALLLAEGMVRRGHAVSIGVHGDGPVADMARARGLAVIALPALPDAAGETSSFERFDLRLAARVRRCMLSIGENTIDLLHLNDRRMMRLWTGPAALTRTPVIVHWRSTYTSSRSTDASLLLAKRIISVSDLAQRSLPAFARKRSNLVYNPFEHVVDAGSSSDAGRAVRARWSIPENALVIGMFGSLLKRKRPHLLIDLLRAMPATIDGRVVWGMLCGRRVSPYDTQLDERLTAWPEAERRVTLTGFVEDPLKHMAACDLIIHPAINEGFGRVGVEAQSAGAPVIVSSACGVAEVITHGKDGFVIAPDDFESWRETCRQLLENPSMRSAVSAEGLRSAARFTLERHVAAVESVYAEAGLFGPT